MPEKIIVSIDGSTLDDWDMCNKRYELRHIRYLTPAWRAKALDTGSLMHLMLKHYYESKMGADFDFDKTVEEAIQIAYLTENDLHPAEIEELIYNVRGYFEKYKGENWRVLEVERAFTVTLYDSDDLQILGQGISDLIVDTPSGLCIVDHKKRSQRSQESPYNHQRMMYTTALGINTFITNKIVFIKDPDRYIRQIDSFDDEQKDEWLTELVMTVKQMLAYQSIGFFKRNPTSCDKYGGCTYRSFCNKSPSRRELMIGRDLFVGEKWDVGKILEEQEKK